jgi:hypothetical protein
MGCYRVTKRAKKVAFLPELDASFRVAAGKPEALLNLPRGAAHAPVGSLDGAVNVPKIT